MDTFGVNTEGELFSGSFVSLRARLCENKNNFTSKYTTDEVIVQQLSQLFYGFRLQYLTSVRHWCSHNLHISLQNLVRR